MIQVVAKVATIKFVVLILGMGQDVAILVLEQILVVLVALVVLAQDLLSRLALAEVVFVTISVELIVFIPAPDLHSLLAVV